MAEKELTGIQYDVGEEHATVVDRLKLEAEGGSVEAMDQLGRIYIEGDGIPQNEEWAAEWFYQSANLGSSLGQLMMGKLHLEGTGVSKNEELAREYLEKAAEQGIGEAKRLLEPLDAALQTAKKNTGIPMEKLYEELSSERATTRDSWEERDLSRGEMVKRLREGTVKLKKKKELERQERMVVIPSSANTGISKKKLPGKSWLILFLLTGIVTILIWRNIFKMSHYSLAVVLEGLASIPAELSDGPERWEIITLGIWFLPPVLCLVSFIGWICAHLQRGKKAGEETRRLNEAREQANTQKTLIKDNISKTAKMVQENLSFLPERYHSIDACEALAMIIEDKRADSLKEALNIYSLERAGGGMPKRQKVSRRGL